MDTLTVLRGAREIFANEPARRTNRYWIGPKGCCCVAGACGLASGEFTRHHMPFSDELMAAPKTAAAIQVLARLAGGPENGPHALTGFNDKATHSEVLALFDRAIADVAATAHESEKKKVPQAVPRRRDNAGCERVEVFV